MRIGSGAILVLLLLCGLDTELITVTLGTQNGGKQIAARISGGSHPKPKNYYKCGTLVTGKGVAGLLCGSAGWVLQGSVCPLGEAIKRG
jgi:hypothetical protein